MAVIPHEGKTAFVRTVLTTNPKANVKDVNAAWKDAGHDGSISDSLVTKMRSELKLTSGTRSRRQAKSAPPQTGDGAVVRKRVGRPPKANGKPEPSADDGAGSSSSPVPEKPIVNAPAQRPVGPPPKANGKHERLATAARPAARERTGVMTRLEGEIDELIFQIKLAGGLHEFEEMLRKARRILVRSYAE